MPTPVTPDNLQAANFFVQYANVLIPLIVSIATAIASFLIYRDKVKNLGDDVKEIEKEIKQIRDKTIACETILKEREPYTKKKSPISLTERGRNFLINSGGKAFIDRNFEDLFQKVEEKQPKTAYDVQEFSKQVLTELQNDDSFIPLKEYLFKEGEPLDELIIVMGIELRDKLLAKKEWKVEDVDKYDPSKTQTD